MGELLRHIAPVALSWDDEAPGQRWRALPGTLVFADISGFTALTERLSRRGRIGAEEIVEVLNRIFGGMLDIAAARGGELLKFGGDAVLFLFRGEDHVGQACDAAVEMRASLRHAAEIPTAVGRLKLSMSVGVHSGDVDLFLVGEPTRELLVLGPAATALAGAEKAAEAGQILLTEAAASALRPADTRPAGPGLRLLRWHQPRRPAPGPSELPDVSEARLATLIPGTLAFHVDQGVPEPEHRTACMAFIRFSGTDSLLAQRGGRALADALHATVTEVNRAVAAEDVTLLTTDLDSDGGKFFLGAGLIRGTEDDEGRMLRSVRAVMDSGAPLPLQAGVNRGHVFAAEIGTFRRASYTGMGDTTNTAARIMAKAPPGHIYAHPSVMDRSRTLFATRPAGPFAMKGKAEPLLVADVGEEIGTREAGADARLPFLGRDHEAAVVGALVAAAAAGTGGTVTITGPAGIGKTRLAHEAVGSETGIRLLSVHAEPYGVSNAYRVFRDPLRDLLGLERTDADMGGTLLRRLAADAPELLPMAPLLADVMAVDVPETPESSALDPQFRPQRLAAAVVDLITLLVPGPLVLLADGMQWADAASADLLERLAAATSERPWALIVVRRDGTAGFTPRKATTLPLEPLDRATIEDLIDAATEATPMLPHEVAGIAERSQGNPMFVEEVTRVVRGGGSLASLPDSVQSALNAQIDLLDPLARRILRYCSVLGRSFRREVAEETLAQFGLEVDRATVAVLAAFVEQDGPQRFRFRNNLVRDTAYEGLAFRLRSRVHAAAATATRRFSSDLDSDAATLSLHYSRAGDNGHTWEFARRAGAVARSAYANADAAAQFALALDAARRLPDVTDEQRARLGEVLGEVRELAGILEGSIAAYRSAEQLTTSAVERAALMARRARVQERAGRYRGAMRAVNEGRALIEGLEDSGARRVRVRLDTLTALIRLGQERPAEARRWAVRAVDSARGIDDPETLVQALMAIDHADLFMGRPVSGEPTREALRIAREQGYLPRESIAWGNLGVAAFYAGRWEEAASCYTKSRETAVQAGNDFGAAETDLNLAEILIGQGRIDEAADVLGKAVKVLTASGLDAEADYGRLQLSRVSLVRGDLEHAQATAADVRARSRREHPITALEAGLMQAQAVTRLGRPREALDLIAEAESEAAARADVAPLKARLHLERARALLDLGQPEESRREVAAGIVAADDADLPYEKALLLRLGARLAQSQDDRESAESAQAESDAIMARLGARV